MTMRLAFIGAGQISGTHLNGLGRELQRPLFAFG